MNNLAKTSAYVGGGGLIIGGGIAAEEFSIENKGGSEEGITIAPALSVQEVVDEGETVEKALKGMKLTSASEISDYQRIFSELKSAGFPGWAKETMKQTYSITVSSDAAIPGKMKNACEKQLKRQFSSFSNPSKNVEFKTIKLVCTTDYSIIDNAKDHWGEENTVYSQEQEIKESDWGKQISAFRGSDGSKTIDEMKKKCVELGGEPYRNYRESKSGDFYKFCVKGTPSAS